MAPPEFNQAGQILPDDNAEHRARLETFVVHARQAARNQRVTLAEKMSPGLTAADDAGLFRAAVETAGRLPVGKTAHHLRLMEVRENHLRRSVELHDLGDPIDAVERLERIGGFGRLVNPLLVLFGNLERNTRIPRDDLNLHFSSFTARGGSRDRMGRNCPYPWYFQDYNTKLLYMQV